MESHFYWTYSVILKVAGKLRQIVFNILKYYDAKHFKIGLANIVLRDDDEQIVDLAIQSA